MKKTILNKFLSILPLSLTDSFSNLPLEHKYEANTVESNITAVVNDLVQDQTNDSLYTSQVRVKTDVISSARIPQIGEVDPSNYGNAEPSSVSNEEYAYDLSHSGFYQITESDTSVSKAFSVVESFESKKIPQIVECSLAKATDGEFYIVEAANYTPDSISVWFSTDELYYLHLWNSTFMQINAFSIGVVCAVILHFVVLI